MNDTRNKVHSKQPQGSGIFRSAPPSVRHVLIAAALGWVPIAHAASDAGTILQQVNPPSSQVPSSNKTGLQPQKQEEGTETSAAGEIEVKGFKIEGNTLFTESALHALVADAEGKTLSLGALNKVAGRISEYYHSHGNTMTQALIPAQKIAGGIVVIRIVEAKYGQVSLDNHSRVADPLLSATLSPLKEGNLINQPQLDYVLLLLSDIPGEITHATLQPGAAVGTTDLLVNTTSVPALNGNATADNYGNSYTGKYRLGGTLNYIDPLHHGDILSIGALTSGANMAYGRMSYETLLNGRGTRAGASVSSLHYTLGGDLTALLGYGTATVSSLWGKHPIVRSSDLNAYLQVQYDRKLLDDRIDSSGTDTNRHLNNVTTSLTGDFRDRLGAGAVTTWNLGVLSGNVGFDNIGALQTDSTAANTSGNYIKCTAGMTRSQGISEANSLYMSWSWQTANHNLDSAEKLIAGGPYTVRAYSMGVLSGDSGYLGTVEIRHNLSLNLLGQWQAIAFVDSEQLTINQSPWVTSANTASLSGAGIGLNWNGPAQWNGRAYVATPVGPVQVLVTSVASTTGWIQIGKGF